MADPLPYAELRAELGALAVVSRSAKQGRQQAL